MFNSSLSIYFLLILKTKKIDTFQSLTKNSSDQQFDLVTLR